MRSFCDSGCNASQGEYGLSNVLMSQGYNIATLMARYAPVRLLWLGTL